MKRILLFAFGLLLCQSAFAQKEIIDKVVAIVGGELILLSEIEEQHALMVSQNQGEMPPNAKCFILDQVLAQKLLVNQAKLDSIELSDAEVEAQLDSRIEQILAYMNDDREQFEEYYGQTVAEVKDAFREDLKGQLLAERMRGQIMSNTSITPKEVREFFDKIPRDSLPYFNSEVEVGEIVIKPVVNDVEKNRAKSELEAIRNEIVNNGADFAELARKNSDDFGSGRIGGDLGFQKRGQFVQEFEAAAYRLDKMEISPVIETQYGFHIIQMLERRGNSIHLRHILIRPQITDADLDLAEAKLDSVRQLIMDDSISFSMAVKKYSNEDVQSYNNDGRMVNRRTGNTFFEIGDLDPDVYFTIDTMKVGSMSAPFAYQDPGGDQYFRIVQLQSQSLPHKANLKEDYSKIREAAIQSKQSEYVAEWVQLTINKTFIQVDPIFQNCPELDKWLNGKEWQP